MMGLYSLYGKSLWIRLSKAGLQILLNTVYNDNILSVVSGKNICENIWSVMWWFHYREANLGLLL